MRQFTLTILLIISGFLVRSYAQQLSEPVNQITINNDHPIIGSVVKLDVCIKAGTKDLIDWEAIDDLFKQSPNLVLLAIRTKEIDNGYFTREFLFTCTKPLKLSVSSLPVIINGQKYTTRPFAISFKSEKIPAGLNDIKSSESVPLAGLIKALLQTGAIIFATLLVFVLGYFIIKRRDKINRSAKLRYLYLQKLAMMEIEMNNEVTSMAVMVSNLSELLKDFLSSQQSALDPEPRLNTTDDYPIPHELIAITNKLKFQPPVAAKSLFPVLFNDIKHFINSYQSTTN